MKPLKIADFLAKKPASNPIPRSIDLRDYGLTHAAPQENGQTILKLQIDPKSGTLLPAA